MPSAEELKIKRRLLQQQVSLIDDKVDRVTEILEKKRAGRPKRVTIDPNEDLSNPLAEERFRRKIASLKNPGNTPKPQLFPATSKVVHNRNKHLLREVEKERRSRLDRSDSIDRMRSDSIDRTRSDAIGRDRTRSDGAVVGGHR